MKGDWWYEAYKSESRRANVAEAEVVRLREALRVYANLASWTRQGRAAGNYEWDGAGSPWDIARAALDAEGVSEPAQQPRPPVPSGDGESVAGSLTSPVEGLRAHVYDGLSQARRGLDLIEASVAPPPTSPVDTE